MRAIVFQVDREGYSVDQLRNPLTVGELKEMLEDLDDDRLVILGHDNEYTVGSLPRRAELRDYDEEGEYETYDEVWA